jgi:hypothetical protein
MLKKRYGKMSDFAIAVIAICIIGCVGLWAMTR